LEYLPSNGASRGSIVIWKSSVFTGALIFQNEYASSILLTSVHNNATWILINFYAPCTPLGKKEFVQWFQGIQMPDGVDWLLVGDFNLYRNPEDRNRQGADFGDMLMFNEAISALGLVELPLKGQRYTWTNKQCPSLLERLVGSFLILIPLYPPFLWKLLTMFHAWFLFQQLFLKDLFLGLRIFGFNMMTSSNRFSWVGTLLF
jgi:hypothetical protein